MSGCTTARGTKLALYINSGGGAAVGTSFSVTAERKPDFAERQILYSDYRPSFTAIKCKAEGFELMTSRGTIAFKEDALDTLRVTPRNLSESAR